jgi:hypothetical protein
MPLFAVLAEGPGSSRSDGGHHSPERKRGRRSVIEGRSGDGYAGDAWRHYQTSAAGQWLQRKFFYVGGEVGSPGEKAFREGMTLTQALLSAGWRVSI